MEKRLESLEMRATTIEANIAKLTIEVSELTKSMQKLVVTIDRGKWLGYGILIMAGVNIFGIKDVAKAVLGL